MGLGCGTGMRDWDVRLERATRGRGTRGSETRGSGTRGLGEVRLRNVRIGEVRSEDSGTREDSIGDVINKQHLTFALNL